MINAGWTNDRYFTGRSHHLMELLYHQAQESSLLSIIHFIVIWPMVNYMVYRIKQEGKAMTYQRAVNLVGMSLCTALAILWGAVQRYGTEPNAYEILQVTRFDKPYIWATKYSQERRAYKNGKTDWTEAEFQRFEHAYDVIMLLCELCKECVTHHFCVVIV